MAARSPHRRKFWHRKRPGRTSATHSSENAIVPARDDSTDRLQKVLAAAGVGSRRECERLIEEGRVQVDGRVVTELGTKADRRRQEIRVDGERLPQPELGYFAIKKPSRFRSASP